MSEYEIENGVKVPIVPRGGYRFSRYPWRNMEVGDSFHEVLDSDEKGQYQRLVSAANSANQRSNGEKKFKACRVDESDPKGVGVRVYRMK